MALILAAVAAFYSWIIMLLIGVIWHTFDVLKPIGFWQAVPFGVLFAILSSALGSSK